MSATTSAPEATPAAVLTYNNDTLLTIDTHPQHSLLASGTVHGEINFYEFKSVIDGSVSCQCIDTLTGGIQHNSCRSLRFSKSGKYLYGGHKNKRLVAIDVETRKQVSEMVNAHEYPINKLHPVSERLLATGDEEGYIKVWDSRTRKEVMSVKEHLDFISDMASKDSYLLSTSGDGSLSVLDLRQKKLDGKSDISESELLSVALVKGGNRVVTGNGEGVLGR